MILPTSALPAPFNVTRASHVVLNVRDLKASLTFYRDVIGLVVTAEGDDVLYLRGVEEACHHSLVLRRSTGATTCTRLGLRVFTERDLELAHDYFQNRGFDVSWVSVPHQGQTLHVTDPFGFPLELCARMDVEQRQIIKFDKHRGGCAQRLDHFQLLTPDVESALSTYCEIGFRLTEYITTDDGMLTGVFLQRKGNPHDVVFFSGAGPRLHHFAYLAQEGHHLLTACDVAGVLGFGEKIERGPGRHGPGHALFVYFRDPDGHRVELFNTHYQTMDIENEPVRWRSSDPALAYPWGLPARRSWFEEATHFDGTRIVQPEKPGNPMTLERYLGDKG